MFVNEQILLWNRSGQARLIEGPLSIWKGPFERIEVLARRVANEKEYLRIQFLNGECQHVAGPAEIFVNPLEHTSIVTLSAKVLLANEAVVVSSSSTSVAVNQDRQSQTVLHGPLIFVPTPFDVVQDLIRYQADEKEYLHVVGLDGKGEHLPGPCSMFHNPLVQKSVTVKKAIDLSAPEVLVVYRQAASSSSQRRGQTEEEKVERKLICGPRLYIPTTNEWFHEFKWHGSPPGLLGAGEKVPEAIRFTKLRVIPDQFYYNVKNVRTKDEALITVKIMLFFELQEVERMLDSTHDPIADFINAITADVISFASELSYEEFVERSRLLNEVETYKQLCVRCPRIGYAINKVVFRGYDSSSTLQKMNDDAITSRTRLRLEMEQQEQSQQLTDMKLSKEFDRANKKQEMEMQDERHKVERQMALHQEKVRQMQEESAINLQQLQNEHTVELKQIQEQNRIRIENVSEENEQKERHLQVLKDLGVDVSAYLMAPYQKAEKLIQIGDSDQVKLHLHEQS